MTRAVHWRRNTERQRLGVLDCGVIRVGALSSRNKKRVTCKRCLKLIGAQQPSGAAEETSQPRGAREGHGLALGKDPQGEPQQTSETTVAQQVQSSAASDHPSVIYLRLGCERRFGQDYVRIWDSSLEPKEGLSRFERFDRGAVAHGISLTAQSMLNERADHIRHLQDYCARLESLLREVVEKFSEWDLAGAAEAAGSWDRVLAAIEAARGGIGGTS